MAEPEPGHPDELACTFRNRLTEASDPIGGSPTGTEPVESTVRRFIAWWVMHPNAAVSYSRKVAQIQAALTRGDVAALEAITLIRGLVREIRITPAPDKMELEVRGDLAALLEQEQRGTKETFTVVAGVGFEPTTFRL